MVCLRSNVHVCAHIEINVVTPVQDVFLVVWWVGPLIDEGGGRLEGGEVEGEHDEDAHCSPNPCGHWEGHLCGQNIVRKTSPPLPRKNWIRRVHLDQRDTICVFNSLCRMRNTQHR